MMRSRLRLGLAIVVGLGGLVPSAGAQRPYPPISARTIVSGSATIKVTGAFNLDEELAINAQGGFGDGEMTWLPFGASGSEKPHALITFTDTNEIGIDIRRGKLQATGGIGGDNDTCTGKVEVTPKLISGHLICTGAASYDPVTGKMGKVNIDIRFTAGS